MPDAHGGKAPQQKGGPPGGPARFFCGLSFPSARNGGRRKAPHPEARLKDGSAGHAASSVPVRLFPRILFPRDGSRRALRRGKENPDLPERKAGPPRAPPPEGAYEKAPPPFQETGPYVWSGVSRRAYFTSVKSASTTSSSFFSPPWACWPPWAPWAPCWA